MVRGVSTLNISRNVADLHPAVPLEVSHRKVDLPHPHHPQSTEGKVDLGNGLKDVIGPGPDLDTNHKISVIVRRRHRTMNSTMQCSPRSATTVISGVPS